MAVVRHETYMTARFGRRAYLVWAIVALLWLVTMTMVYSRMCMPEKQLALTNPSLLPAGFNPGQRCVNRLVLFTAVLGVIGLVASLALRFGDHLAEGGQRREGAEMNRGSRGFGILLLGGAFALAASAILLVARAVPSLMNGGALGEVKRGRDLVFAAVSCAALAIWCGLGGRRRLMAVSQGKDKSDS
jgi:hypothetical protein